MKIDLNNLDRENFKIKDGEINKNKVFLVNPKEIGTKWNKDNLIFRSSIWDINGDLVSAGLQKFFNYGEKPELYPPPEKYKDWLIEEKLDGSLCLVDYVFGFFNIRTRGTINCDSLNNSQEFYDALNNYPGLLDFIKENSQYTYLFEIVSPSNVIVLNYGALDLYFLGAINKDNYLYFPVCSEIGVRLRDICKIKTPKTYDGEKNITHLASQVKEWQKKEGVVLKYNQYQNFIKIKSDWYLFHHRMKSELSSIDKVIDLFFYLDCPDYSSFYRYVCETFDFEIAEITKGYISKVSDAYKEVIEIVGSMESFATNLKYLNRKKAALKILGSYSNTNRASFVFCLLDGKKLTRDQKKKLLYQIIKNS